MCARWGAREGESGEKRTGPVGGGGAPHDLSAQKKQGLKNQQGENRGGGVDGLGQKCQGIGKAARVLNSYSVPWVYIYIEKKLVLYIYIYTILL
jgi:hypothetical protein